MVAETPSHRTQSARRPAPGTSPPPTTGSRGSPSPPRCTCTPWSHALRVRRREVGDCFSQDVALTGDSLQLGTQLADLRPLLSGRRAGGLLAGLANPVAERRVVQLQLAGDLGDLATRGLDHRHGLSLELRCELPPRSAATR